MKILNGYKALFAEGPFWDAEDEVLMYVDLANCRVIRHDIAIDKVETWEFSTPITAIMKFDELHYILVTNQKLILFNKKTFAQSDYYRFDKLEQYHLLNDAKMDLQGNIWIGTVDARFRYFKENPATALKVYTEQPSKLYRLSKEKKLIEYEFPITLSNGIAINEDQKKLYHVDSAAQAIFKMDFDEEGNVTNRMKHFECEQIWGFPDGITIDSNGDLWVPLFKSKFIAENYGEGSKMLKICGDSGAILEEYNFSLSHITSCQFGGEYLQYLFVTTVNELLGMDEKDKQVNAGKVHQLEVGISGRRNEMIVNLKAKK